MSRYIVRVPRFRYAVLAGIAAGVLIRVAVMTAATATMRKLLLVLNSALKRDPTYLELKTVTDRRQPRIWRRLSSDSGLSGCADAAADCG